MKIHTVFIVRHVDREGSDVDFCGNFTDIKDAIERVKEILAEELEEFIIPKSGTHWTKEEARAYYAQDFSGIVDANGNYPVPHQYGGVDKYLQIVETKLNDKVNIKIA